VKKTVLGLVFLCAIHSQAATANGERVGDWTEYKISLKAEGSSVTETGKMRQEIINYDNEGDQYLVRETVDLGDIDIHDDWIDASEIFTPETGSLVVSQCVKDGGSLEKFDLNGTTYDVCKKYWAQQSFDIFGPFPIDGRASFVNLQETNATGELIDFHFN
jgi:hypothetical protein